MLVTTIFCFFQLSVLSWDGMASVWLYTELDRGGLAMPVNLIHEPPSTTLILLCAVDRHHRPHHGVQQLHLHLRQPLRIASPAKTLWRSQDTPDVLLHLPRDRVPHAASHLPRTDSETIDVDGTVCLPVSQVCGRTGLAVSIRFSCFNWC